MQKNLTSSRASVRMFRLGVLVASLALIGCSSGGGSSQTGGSTGMGSGGQSGGRSGGASGGSSSHGGSSSASSGGRSISSSISSGGSSGGTSSGGSSSPGGSLAGGSSANSSLSSTAPITGGTCLSSCTTSSYSSSTTSPTGGTGGAGGTSNLGGTSSTGGTSGAGGTGGRSTGGVDAGAGVGGGSGAPDAASPDSGTAQGFCPSDGTACKIMPLGDSITDGMGSSGGGYRVPLFKLALTDSKNITFVGRNSNGPGSVTVNGQTKQFPQGHEGYSGWTIQDGGGRSGIYGKVDGAMQTNLPHIITLMIGTNDVNISLDLTNAPKRLGELLDKIIADAPKALIVVAKLVPTTNDTTNGRVRTYNDGIAPIVQQRISAGKNLKMVDMYAAFTANTSYKTALMNDELHPKDAGYEVMAKTWYDAIKAYLY